VHVIHTGPAALTSRATGGVCQSTIGRRSFARKMEEPAAAADSGAADEKEKHLIGSCFACELPKKVRQRGTDCVSVRIMQSVGDLLTDCGMSDEKRNPLKGGG
jgi:hypothetical protein